ncbi:MAG: MATE family efflux transporter, partial [Anaerovoracaceae bacterium]
MPKWVCPDFTQHTRIDSKSFYKKLTSLALPIAIQSFISSSLNLVDSLMVGSLGETELAAVGIGLQPFFLFWMILFGFNGGCSTFTAQFWGV